MTVVEIFIAIIFWFIPSLLGTWMLWKILKRDFLPEFKDLNIDEYGFTLSDLFEIVLFVVGTLFVLILCWLPIVNLAVINLFLEHYSIWKFNEIYIIKPRNKQTDSNPDSEYDGIIYE